MSPENQFNNLNQEQTPVKRKHTLIWIVSLVVILLIVIVTTGYFILAEREITETQINPENSTLDTANWQTYRNEEYGFELKYPTDWKFADNSGTDNDIQYLRINIESPSRVDLPGYEGVPVTYRILFWPGGDDPDHNITSYGDFGSDQLSKQSWWNLALDESIKRTTDEYKIGEQIISTFQSIDKDETADWQTYRNEEYGFEFKYPNWFLAVYPSPGGGIREVALSPISFEDLARSADLAEGGGISSDNFLQHFLKFKDVITIRVGNTHNELVTCYSPTHQIVIGGVQGCKNIREDNWTQIMIDLPVPSVKSKYLQISKNDSTDYPEVFDQILSTFRFLD